MKYNTRLRQAFAQQVHAVIGEHGQEQVGADAAGLDMENGTQARLALQAAEGGLDFGQLPVRLHDCCFSVCFSGFYQIIP